MHFQQHEVRRNATNYNNYFPRALTCSERGAIGALFYLDAF